MAEGQIQLHTRGLIGFERHTTGIGLLLQLQLSFADQCINIVMLFKPSRLDVFIIIILVLVEHAQPIPLPYFLRTGRNTAHLELGLDLIKLSLTVKLLMELDSGRIRRRKPPPLHVEIRDTTPCSRMFQVVAFGAVQKAHLRVKFSKAQAVPALSALTELIPWRCR